MVSVAGPGGSVGPHSDQYDVFLLQAQGSRRWQIAESFDDKLLPDSELNVLQRFQAEQEWVLEPGDLLYLPPGIAHHGVALDPCMTWSIGMRAPSAADFFQTFGEWLADQQDEGERYRDPGLEVAGRSGEIDSRAIGRFHDFFRTGNLGERRFFSVPRRLPFPLPPGPRACATGRGNQPCQLDGITHAGRKTQDTTPGPGCSGSKPGSGARLFAAGTEYSCTMDCAQTICDPDRLDQLGLDSASASDLELLCELLNRGHLYLEQL